MGTRTARQAPERGSDYSQTAAGGEKPGQKAGWVRGLAGFGGAGMRRKRTNISRTQTLEPFPRTRKWQMGTRESFLGTQKWRMGTRESFLGAQKWRMGTQESFLGAQKWRMGTRESFLGTQKWRMGTRETRRWAAFTLMAPVFTLSVTVSPLSFPKLAQRFGHAAPALQLRCPSASAPAPAAPRPVALILWKQSFKTRPRSQSAALTLGTRGKTTLFTCPPTPFPLPPPGVPPPFNSTSLLKPTSILVRRCYAPKETEVHQMKYSHLFACTAALFAFSVLRSLVHANPPQYTVTDLGTIVMATDTKTIFNKEVQEGLTVILDRSEDGDRIDYSLKLRRAGEETSREIWSKPSLVKVEDNVKVYDCITHEGVLYVVYSVSSKFFVDELQLKDRFNAPVLKYSLSDFSTPRLYGTDKLIFKIEKRGLLLVRKLQRGGLTEWVHEKSDGGETRWNQVKGFSSK